MIPPGFYIDPAIVEATRNEFEYVVPETTVFERILILLKLEKRLRPIKIKRRTLCELIPKVKMQFPEPIYKIT